MGWWCCAPQCSLNRRPLRSPRGGPSPRGLPARLQAPRSRGTSPQWAGGPCPPQRRPLCRPAQRHLWHGPAPTESCSPPQLAQLSLPPPRPPPPRRTPGRRTASAGRRGRHCRSWKRWGPGTVRPRVRRGRRTRADRRAAPRAALPAARRFRDQCTRCGGHSQGRRRWGRRQGEPFGGSAQLCVPRMQPRQRHGHPGPIPHCRRR